MTEDWKDSMGPCRTGPTKPVSDVSLLAVALLDNLDATPDTYSKLILIKLALLEAEQRGIEEAREAVKKGFEA